MTSYCFYKNNKLFKHLKMGSNKLKKISLATFNLKLDSNLQTSKKKQNFNSPLLSAIS